MRARAFTLGAVVLVLCGCGRLGFDALDDNSVDGDPDASTAAICQGVADGADCGAGTCLDEACVPPEWTLPIGGSSAVSIGTDVTVDAEGRVFTSLRFDGPITVGGMSFDTNGGDDILIVGVARDGTVMWADQVGGVNDDSSWSLAVGPDGNVYVGAAVRGEIDLGFGVTTGGGSGDNAVLSYQPDGTQRWAVRVADPGWGSAGDIGFDAAGNVYLAGTFFGTADFGGGPVSSSSADGYDGKIWSLTPDGDYRTFLHWGLTGTSATRGVSVDSAGNLFFAMLLDGSVDIGGGVLRSPTGSNDIVFASVDPSGAHRWSFIGGGTGGLGQNMAVDSNDNVYGTGQYRGTIDMGGFAVSAVACNDGMFASWTSDGTPRWIQPIDSDGCDIAREAMVGDDDTIYVAGTIGGEIDLGGGALPYAGGEDVFVARFSADGYHLWSTTIGGVGDDDAFGIALGPNGDVLLSGSFSGPVDFGDGMVTPANRDAYIVRLNPRLP